MLDEWVWMLERSWTIWSVKRVWDYLPRLQRRIESTAQVLIPHMQLLKLRLNNFVSDCLKINFQNCDFAPDAIDICIIAAEIGHNYLATTHVSHGVLKGELVEVSKYPKWRIRQLLAYTRCHTKTVTMIVMAFHEFFFLFEWNNQNVIICWMGLSNKRQENDSRINWESDSMEIWIQWRR